MKHHKLVPNFIKSYFNGNSLRKIAREEDVSPNTVKKYLQSNGVSVKGHQIIKKIKKNDELLIGTYIGIWAGDGTQYYDRGYAVKICNDTRNFKLNKFIQPVLLDLFGKNSRLVHETRHGALIRFNSKFIYYFVYDYLDFNKNKALSVRLKNSIDLYPKRFTEGFLLGLMLTDGYLKKSFKFTTISKLLSENIVTILKSFKMNPQVYVHKRRKYGWHDLYMVSLNKKEGLQISTLLDKFLKELGSDLDFATLKLYKE